jgi:aminocarboxymuconate-semialdehyde decarboxylase
MTAESQGRLLDCHAHYVSPLAVRAAAEHPERYGVRVETMPGQGERVLMPGEAPGRPLPADLLDLTRRGEKLPGFTAQVVGTWMDVTGYRLPAEEGLRWSELLNDSFAEDLSSFRGSLRFAALANVPMQDARAAAGELERCVSRHGFRGAMIATNVAGANLDEARFDPFWQKAQELNVPVVLHPFAVVGPERMERYYLGNALGNPTDTTIAAASLIFGGVLDRFPNLQIVLMHGGGFLPYQYGRLDHARDVRPEPGQNGAGMPRDYLRRFLFDSIVFSPRVLRYLVDAVGADRVLLGTDYPFDMGDYTPTERLAQTDLDAQTQRTIREGAALKV